MNRYILSYIFLLTSALLIISCSKTIDYNWVIYNSGKTKINNAHISYNKFKSVGGIVIPDSTKTHMINNRKIPEMVSIKWISKSGKEYIKNLKLTEKIPTNIKSGSSLVFEINNKNEVKFYVKPPFKF